MSETLISAVISAERTTQPAPESTQSGRRERTGAKKGTNLAFTFIEITRGLWTNSIVILTDALHDSGDRASLGLAWYFDKPCQRAGAHRCEDRA